MTKSQFLLSLLTVAIFSFLGAGSASGGFRILNGPLSLLWSDNSGTAANIEKQGGAGVALWGRNNGSTGSGTVGYSANWYGIYGYTGAASNNYGIYSPDNLYTRNVQSAGAFMLVAQNSGTRDLSRGEIAAFSGIDDRASPLEDQPLLQAAAFDQFSADTAVAGVVYGYFDPAHLNASVDGLIDGSVQRAEQSDPDRPITPGDYMLLVVYGPAWVKTDTSVRLRAGDLIQASPRQSGRAMRALHSRSAQLPGTVLGKALGGTREGDGSAYVFVTL